MNTTSLSGAIARLRSMDRQQFETIFTSSAFMLTAGLTFLNAILLTRGLGPAGRGAVAAVYANTLVLGWAFQIGFPAAAGYFAKDIDNRRVVMSSWAATLFYAVPMALLLTPFYLWQMTGDAFEEFGTGLKLWYVAFIVVNLFNGPFLSAVFWLRGVGSLVKFNVFLALPQVLITLGYAVLFLLDRLTVFSALTSTFAAIVVSWTYALISTSSLPGRGYSSEAFKKIRHFSLRSWVGNLSFFVSLRLDLMLLVGIVSSDDLGLYAAAVAFSTMSSPVARGVAQAVLPFVRKAADDAERLSRIRQSLLWVSAASAATLTVIALTAEFVLPFLFTSRFDGAVRPLLFLLPGAFATDVTQVYTTALSSFDRPEDASKAQVASAVATVVGLAVLIRPYGIIGAATTTSIAYWVALLVSIYYWRRLRGQVLRGEATGHTEAIPHEDAAELDDDIDEVVEEAAGQP